jgi:hypothetical protein
MQTFSKKGRKSDAGSSDLQLLSQQISASIRNEAIVGLLYFPFPFSILRAANCLRILRDPKCNHHVQPSSRHTAVGMAGGAFLCNALAEVASTLVYGAVSCLEGASSA